MRDLLKLFNRRYSAVNATDNINPNPSAEENLQHLQQLGFEQRNRKKSLQATMPLKRGITIVDSFFNQRRDGKRYPKCKIHPISCTYLLLLLLLLNFFLFPINATDPFDHTFNVNCDCVLCRRIIDFHFDFPIPKIWTELFCSANSTWLERTGEIYR